MSSAISPEDLTELADGEVTAAVVHTGPLRERPAALRIAAPVKVVIASSFVLRLAGASTAIMLAAYLRQVVNAEADLIGILAALFYVTELTLAPVFGALSDLRGRRLILVLGPLVGAIALPIYPFSALASVSIVSVMILAMARLLEGVSTAAKVPSALGYLADSTTGTGPEETAQRGRVMGYYEITFLIGLVFGTIAGGALWQAVYVWGFYLVALIYLVAAAMLFFWVPETLPSEAREHHAQLKEEAQDAAHPIRALLRTRLQAYSALLKVPALRSFVPAWLAINAVVGLLGNLVQPLLLHPRNGNPDRFPAQALDGKFTSTEVGFIFAGFGLVFMVGILAWSLVYGRVRKSNVMLTSVFGLGLVSVALFAINDRVLPELSWLYMSLLILGIFLASGFTPVALAYLAEISGARVEHRGAVMGLYSVFLAVGQLVGSGAGGVFVTSSGLGFNGLILAMAILAGIAGVAVVWLRTRHRI